MMKGMTDKGMPGSPDELKRLAANVARLSTLLTRERDALPPAYLKDQGLREAYLRYFLPANVQKIHLPLSELELHPDGLLQPGRLRVLDLGAGPGTALLGVLTFFAARKNRPSLECTAVDQVGENLQAAGELFASCRTKQALDASLRTVRASVESAGQDKEPFDLIILSNALNELFPLDADRIEKRVNLVKNALDRQLADRGSCIIIEPALRETSRELLAVRDGLRERGVTVYSPCLAQGACPALANPKDWCHEDIPWEPTALIKELDARAGLRKDSLKFSYLVLRKDGRSLPDAFGEAAFRVVSEPLVTKGKRELYLCGAEGRKLAARLDKDRTTANALFETLRRGDLASFERMVDEGKRFKVQRDTVVDIHSREP